MVHPCRTFLLLTFFAATAATHAQSKSNSSPSVAGPFVAGVSIAGLDNAPATRRLKRELAPKLEQRITLTLGSKLAYRKRKDLGFHLDIPTMLSRASKGAKTVPLAFKIDVKTAAGAMKRLAPAISSQPRNAQPVLTGGKVRIRPEVVGHSLDTSQSAARLKIAAEHEATLIRFDLAGATKSPRVTKTQLKGITGVLGTFTTRFNSGQVKRTNNMRVAIRSIDGTLLPAKAVFSLNKTVGERTQARGFRTAIIFEDGQKKPGLGGGVSQVTGTLFNAALRAGLPIVTYRTHSRPVSYLPIGRDATVAWGSFDMKFKNNTSAPIFISYKISGSHATATLFGHLTGTKATMRVVSKKNGKRDISAILFRTIRQNGKVVQKERVGSSHYLWKKDEDE